MFREAFDAEGASPPTSTNNEHVNKDSLNMPLWSLVADLEHLIYGDEMPKQKGTHRPTKVAKTEGDDTPNHNGPAFSIEECILQLFCDLDPMEYLSWRNQGLPKHAAIRGTDNEAVSDTIASTPKDGETLTTDQVLQLLDHRKTGPLKYEGFVVWCGKSDDLQTGEHRFVWMTHKRRPQSHGKRAKTQMKAVRKRVYAYLSSLTADPAKSANEPPSSDMPQTLKAQLAESSSRKESGKDLAADTSANDENMAETELEKGLREELIKRDILRLIPAAASASHSQDKGKKKDDATSKVTENPIPESYLTLGDAFAAMKAQLKSNNENQHQQCLQVRQGKVRVTIEPSHHNGSNVVVDMPRSELEMSERVGKARQAQLRRNGDTITSQEQEEPSLVDSSLKSIRAALEKQDVVNKIEALEKQQKLNQRQKESGRHNCEACACAGPSADRTAKSLNDPSLLKQLMGGNQTSEAGQKYRKMASQALAVSRSEAKENDSRAAEEVKRELSYQALCNAADATRRIAADLRPKERDPAGPSPFSTFEGDMTESLVMPSMEIISEGTLKGWIVHAVVVNQVYLSDWRKGLEEMKTIEAYKDRIEDCQALVDLYEHWSEFFKELARGAAEEEKAKAKAKGPTKGKEKGKEKARGDRPAEDDNGILATAWRKHHEYLARWIEKAAERHLSQPACSSPSRKGTGEEEASAVAGPSRTQSERAVVEEDASTSTANETSSDADRLILSESLGVLAHEMGYKETFDKGLECLRKQQPLRLRTLAEGLAIFQMLCSSTSTDRRAAIRHLEANTVRRIAAFGGAVDDDAVSDADASPSGDDVGGTSIGPDSVGGPPVADTDTSRGGPVDPASTSSSGSSDNPADSENTTNLRGGGLDEPAFLDTLEEGSWEDEAVILEQNEATGTLRSTKEVQKFWDDLRRQLWINDDDIYDSEFDYGEEAKIRREARDAVDDEYLARLRGDSSTSFTMDTFSMGPSINDNDKSFDSRFIKSPVPTLMTRHNTAALGPASQNVHEKHAAGMMDIRCRNLFPPRNSEEDPTDLNREFEEEAAATAKRAEKPLVVEHVPQLIAKEPGAAPHYHSWPPRKSQESNKEKSMCEKLVAKRAKTWPGRKLSWSLFPPGAKKENLDPYMNSYEESRLKILLRRWTGRGKD